MIDFQIIEALAIKVQQEDADARLKAEAEFEAQEVRETFKRDSKAQLNKYR